MFAPVTIYSQPGCGPCGRVKRMLTDAGVEFDDVDLTRNDEARTYVTQVLKAGSVPVVASDDFEPIIGFQLDALRELVDFYKEKK